jgi:hypothetical protein
MAQANTSEQPNLLQTMLTASRQERAKSEDRTQETMDYHTGQILNTPNMAQASTSEQPNLLQSMLTASRQERAKAEEMAISSEVEKRVEAAKQEWIAQARAEVECHMSQARAEMESQARAEIQSLMSQAATYVLPFPW